MKVLFNKNITAVPHQAILESQNRYWPMSQTSRISGCRRQKRLYEARSRLACACDPLTLTPTTRPGRGIPYQTVNDVYKTTPAINTVRIKPGTRPRIEYDQGKDIMARQIYSENSRAAV